MVGSGSVDWQGLIPKHWNLTRLKFLIESRDGGAWGTEPSDTNIPLICLRIADFNYKKLRFIEKNITEYTYRGYNKNAIQKLELEKGDLLVEKSGGGEKTPVGRVVLFDKNFNALFANFMDKLKVNKTIICPEFLNYWFSSFYQSRRNTLYIKQTIGIQNLDLGALLSTESVYYPSEKEQQSIANFLDKKCSEIDSLTADIENQISLLEDYKKSVITEAVTKGLDPNVEMKDSGVEWIGDIPKHWIISKIKHIAKINPKCNIRKLNLYSVVTYSPMECIRNNTFENRPINYEELPPSLTRFQEGDLVMAKVSPCFENGNISIMKDLYSGVGFGSSELFVFRANPITTRYLCYFLQNTNCKNYEILSFSGIAGLQRINSDHLRNTNITIPNINEQKQIADYLDKKCSEIDSLISDKNEQLEKLASYKQSMIYEYVTGKKEVPSKEIA